MMPKFTFGFRMPDINGEGDCAIVVVKTPVLWWYAGRAALSFELAMMHIPVFRKPLTKLSGFFLARSWRAESTFEIPIPDENFADAFDTFVWETPA